MTAKEYGVAARLTRRRSAEHRPLAAASADGTMRAGAAKHHRTKGADVTDVSLPATGQTPPTVEPFLRVTIAGAAHDLTPAGAAVLARALDEALDSTPRDLALASRLPSAEAIAQAMLPPAAHRTPAAYGATQPPSAE